MLNRFYFLAEECRAAGVGGGRIAVAYAIDGRPGQVERLLEQQYSADGNYPFCVLLRGDEPDALARKALLLLFHPSYVVAEKGKPVFVERSDAAIEEIFREQRLEVDLIPLEAVRTLHAEGHDPAGDYYRYCLTSYSPGDVFLLSGGDIGGWTSSLEMIDLTLAEEHERWYQLAVESRTMRSRAAAQEREIVRLREEQKITRELLELSNRHNEVDYILKFYRNEYEILPLWYKRFGHIIKVIQGKRSFRSLFDKRAKKYKD